jgi:NADH-quinone oxidoreductase subunit F
MDDSTCMVEVARFFMKFTQNDRAANACPGREGTKRMLVILERIVAGEGEDGDIEAIAGARGHLYRRRRSAGWKNGRPLPL